MIKKVLGCFVFIVMGTCKPSPLWAEQTFDSFDDVRSFISGHTVNINSQKSTKYKDFESCHKQVASDIQLDLSFNKDKHPRYQEILTQMTREEQAKLEKYKTTPLTRAIKNARCNSVHYTCEVGQKPVDCEPEPCWSLAAGIKEGLFLQNDAEKAYVEEQANIKCAEYATAQKPSTPAPQPTTTTPTQQTTTTASTLQAQQPSTPTKIETKPNPVPAPVNTPPKTQENKQPVQSDAPVAVPSEVHSTIVDNTGEGLVGASVRIKETNQGVVADTDGNFTIKPASGAKNLTITYVGMAEQSFPINSVPSKIIMKEDSTVLGEVVVAACGKSALDSLHASAGIISQKTKKCIPTKCNTNYELGNQEYLTDEDGAEELDDDGQKILVNSECISTSGRDCSPMPANAKIAKQENGKCVIKKCDEPRYKLENNTCADQVGKDCATQINHAVTATYQLDGANLKCIVTQCEEPGWVPNAKGTKCETSDGPCSDAQIKSIAHASAGNLRKGECVITECEKGWHVSKDGKKCEQAKLSEEDSQAKVNELRDNAQKMKDKEQSLENRMLGAATIAATGIGTMNMMSGMAEQKSDQAAEEDMKAYLATFVCDYGAGRNIKGGEMNIDLPGGNDLTAMAMEYRALAADLKVRKEALGKQPGIESEVIYDIAETGLYDNVGIGRQSGAYTSVSKALMDENSKDAAAWSEQTKAAKDKTKTGAITAGAGAVGGIAGNMAINGGDDKKNKVNEIQNKYDMKRQETAAETQ